MRKLIFSATGIIALTALFLAWQYFGRTPLPDIATFGDCVKVGHPVFKSYPRQCKTPDGRTFFEDIGNILEKENLVGKDLGKMLRRRLEEIEKAYLRSLPSGLLHGDFIPGNILVDGEKVCVLDFSWVGRGCNYFDITAFWLVLQRLGEAPKYSRKKISLLQRAFLEGYGGISEGSVEFRSFELLQRVNSLLCRWEERQKSGWARRRVLDLEIKNQLRWLREFKEQI